MITQTVKCIIKFADDNPITQIKALRTLDGYRRDLKAYKDIVCDDKTVIYVYAPPLPGEAHNPPGLVDLFNSGASIHRYEGTETVVPVENRVVLTYQPIRNYDHDELVVVTARSFDLDALISALNEVDPLFLKDDCLPCDYGVRMRDQINLLPCAILTRERAADTLLHLALRQHKGAVMVKPYTPPQSRALQTIGAA
jgi:hypothetical protein